MREHLVIAGGGQAATQAAQSARQAGFQGAVTLVAAEAHLPYQRPPLSKSFLAGELERSRLFLKPERFFESREIELALDTSVEQIDPARKRVSLSGGDVLDYSHLLLALGSEPRKLGVPGHELDGVCGLRTIGDVESIRQALDGAARLLVVGAGYIGLEVAAVAAKAGLQVTVLEAASHAMSRSVCPEVADFFVDRHRQAGVDVRFNTRLTAFLGDAAVEGAETGDGKRLECDLAIVAVGILPCVGIAESAGLATDNGISVDPGCRTSAPGIFAAGDCTSHTHPWVGRRVRLESVQNAIEQGKTAAASICGQDAAFDAIPWFWSDQYDLKLQIAGLSSGFDQVVVRGRPDDGSFSVFYLESGRLIAVDSINDPRTFMAARKFLAGKPSWPAEVIADTDCDLSGL